MRLTSHYNIERKIKICTATQVSKYLNFIKKNDTAMKFNYFNHCIITRGSGNRVLVPKSASKAGRRCTNIQFVGWDFKERKLYL